MRQGQILHSPGIQVLFIAGHIKSLVDKQKLRKIYVAGCTFQPAPHDTLKSLRILSFYSLLSCSSRESPRLPASHCAHSSSSHTNLFRSNQSPKHPHRRRLPRPRPLHAPHQLAAWFREPRLQHTYSHSALTAGLF